MGGLYFPELGVCYFTDANTQNIRIIRDYFNISLYWLLHFLFANSEAKVYASDPLKFKANL